MEIINDAQWINGSDSISYTLGQGSYQWAQNVVNRGGIIETRQGFAEIDAIAQEDPRGVTMVTIGATTWLVAAIGDSIYKLNLNSSSSGLQKIAGLNFPVSFPSRRMVHFEVCVQAQLSVKVVTGNTTSYNTKQITPKFVVIIQDGVSPPQYWDGTKAGIIDEHPDFKETKPNNTPIGLHMQWAGDRLWVAQGRKIRASNLLNPFQFTEELITASGGFFFLPDNATGMGVTHDYKQLLVFTHFTTSAFQVGIEDRTTWPSTQDFQRVVYPAIGCVSHRTIINMYGMTWWMSHEGLVGLDNALAAYQTTRLDVQDLNMIRSKEGISWANGGGCAGSYSNFLFFSVPSASKWNQHTWCMDQAPINTLSGMAPPVWAANWTGLRPEQWVTGQVGGKQRCFCISRDLTNTGHQSTIWEVFIGQRMDVPMVGTTRTAKDIGCAFESRFYGLSPNQYCKLRWVELDLAEIVGDVKLQVYYCGRRTSYKKIIDTHLTATVSQGTEEIFDPNDSVKVYTPQYRTIRSVTDVHDLDDKDVQVQTPYLRNMDREFSVLVQWSGQMALSGLRLAVDPEPDYLEGASLVDEYLLRNITTEGEGGIGCTLPAPNAPTGRLTSQYMAPTKPRWVEFPAYDSAVPNGVFFVAELIAVPPPGEYPLNNYPIAVTLDSETQGDSIYYTQDGSKPQQPPNPHGELYASNNRPSMLLKQTLKAIGFRAGMNPSPEFSGQYTQAKCEDVILDPPPGGFPPEQFVAVPPPLDVGLVSAYNFDALVNGKIFDFSVSPKHGNPINVTLVTGKNGKAGSFNGTSAYVYIGNPDALKLTGSSTWMAWVKATTADPTGDAHIISKADNTKGWSLKTSKSTGQHRFCLQVNGPLINHQSLTVRALNTWYHVAAVYNAENKTISMVINGKLDDGVLNGTVPAPMVDSGANAYIGTRQGGVGYFRGQIDDVRVYNRALSLAEIQSCMNKPVVAVVVQSPLAVRLTCATAGSDIRYFSGGNHVVTSADKLYDPATPVHPIANAILSAKAFKQYYLPSTQTGGKYSSVPRCATPTLTPDTGTYPPTDYNPKKSVSMSSSTAGSKLRYTINNSDINSGTVANNPSSVQVAPNDTLRVISQKDGSSDSLTKTATYSTITSTVATPTFSPVSPIRLPYGTRHVVVTVSCATPNVAMHYIIVQQPPSDHSNDTPTCTTGIVPVIVDGKFTVDVGAGVEGTVGAQGKWLKVVACRPDMFPSAIAVCDIKQNTS
jgi:hypothetical protein